MVFNERPTKRMKRRVTADLYDFLTFPSAGDFSDAVPFRNRVHRFLSDHARVTFPPSFFPSLMTWHILFRVGEIVDGADHSSAMVTLDIVEEDVTCSRSTVYCDQCRVVGWSGHPVCRKRFHFIIRSASDAIEAYQRPCSKCGTLLQLSEARCKSCNLDICVDDMEDWVYLQIEDNTHLLHGVVHSNGYGHLLTLNGREGGSPLLSGSDIIGFWDRLCAAISVRKVSVMDLSKKFGLDYRLLHAITKGHSWYGNWGYEFGTGCYGLTKEAYKKAVGTLSNIPLSSFLFQGRGPQNRVQSVISLYQSLADTELLTIRDLFSFLLRLVHEFRKPRSAKATRPKFTSSCNILCAWTRIEVEDVQQALIKVLLASSACNKAKWFKRQTLKGAVSMRVGSPGLIDYSLKHLPGKLAANEMVVCSRCNPIASTVEFRLEPFTNAFISNSSYPSEEQVISDLTFLFNTIIQLEKKKFSYRPKNMRKTIADSARTILDCKQFMKNYETDHVTTESPSDIKLWCHVELSDQPKDDHPSPPSELIVLPIDATVDNLKDEVTSAFQDVYAMYKRFQAEELLGYGKIRNSYTLKFLFGASTTVRILGKCPAKHGLSRFRKERGTEEWKVDCTCGAKDDDGEKMLACDTCGVWQHTRCAGIGSSAPSKFVCTSCVNSYGVKTKKFPVSSSEACKLNTSCRDEATATDAAVACNIKVNFGVR